LKRVVEKEEEEKRGRESGGGNAEAKPQKRDGEEGEDIPPERPNDLRVFPQNPNFLSQPVLSEEFREAIWERILKHGMSVREVSAELKVEMSRVGAVVRLKEIEKEWQRIVSLYISSLFFPATIMMIFKISISL
jgi:hypothetical protein